MGHVASYAELAMLMSPRPFMVEAGHRDGGQRTEHVAGEFGKVRRHYDMLKSVTGPKSNSSTVHTPSTAKAHSDFCTDT